MTRRILLVFLAFTAALLVSAVVPLALDAANHDRVSFIQTTAGMVRTDAAVAQARLDGMKDLPLLNVFNEVQQAGDGLVILRSRRTVDPAGRSHIQESPLIEAGKLPAKDWAQFAAQIDESIQFAGPGHHTVQPVTEAMGSWVVAAVPVYQRGKYSLEGTVILARSTTSLNGDIVELWVILGTIAAVAMIGATLLAFGLARWVSKPLAGLDATARRLADGDLKSRAVVDSGPPELRRLAATFNTMAGRLEALVHGHRAVIADVSHQLRTPLAALRLRLDLLAADTDPDPQTTAHELAGALEELARLSRLVDGLLAVARAENVVPTPTAVDVAAVARERVVAWHPVADDRGIMLRAVSPPRPPLLAWIGEGHLEQVLDNIIANALDALSAGGRVIVTASATTTGARITVADDGPGMNAEDRERAFLRFTTSNPNGTGLGLAIVHRLVTSNGGTARLAETPGGGLTAVLDLPGVPAPDNTAAEYPSSAQDLASR